MIPPTIPNQSRSARIDCQAALTPIDGWLIGWNKVADDAPLFPLTPFMGT